MALRLTVAGSQSHALTVSQSTKVFDGRGGTIGRGDDCDWQLPDTENIVSRVHAEIEASGDEYWIVDRSQNGTFLDDTEHPIGMGRKQRLKHGSRLWIGRYEVDVSVEAVAPASRGAVPPRPASPRAGGNNVDGNPFESDRRFDPATPVVRVDDILKNFPDRNGGVEPAARRPAEPDHVSPLKENFRPRAVAPPVEQQPAKARKGAKPTGIPDIPQDFVERAKKRKNPPPWPAEESEPKSSPEGPMRHVEPMQKPTVDREPIDDGLGLPASPDAAVVRLLEAAGLDNDSARTVASEVSVVEALGRSLSVVVRCIMETLDARADIKREFGLPVTEYRAESNNPLKCSDAPEEALFRLLMRGDSPYMDTHEAFDEAARDIRAHQVAMMAGMRAAFRSMLAHFDPNELEKHHEETTKQSPLLKIAGKGRFWEMYKQHFAEVTGDASTNFQRLFGRQFAHAYWEQLQRLQERKR